MQTRNRILENAKNVCRTVEKSTVSDWKKTERNCQTFKVQYAVRAGMLLIKTWNRYWSAPHVIFFPNISWRFFVFGTVGLECIADVRLRVMKTELPGAILK